MINACSAVQGVEVETEQDSTAPCYEADMSVQGVIFEVERRNVRNLEASNAAIAAHIGALAERIARVECEQQKTLETPRPTADEGDDEEKGGREKETEEEAPDQQQSVYADFIATTQTNLNCVGMHSWSLCAASRRGASRGGACAALVPSILLLIFQCVVLQAISLGSSYPTCTRNEDCRAGTWCAPSKGPGGYSRVPGMCDDCRWAGKLSQKDYNNLPLRYNADAYAAMTASDLNVFQSLATAVSHCDASDSEPEKCDFIVNLRNQLTLGPLVVLIFVTSVMIMSLVMDMDKQAQIADVFEYRVANMASSDPSRFIISVASLIFTLRKFVLPGMTMYAYATLVLAGPLAQGRSLPLAFVLSALAVSFVYNVDSLLAMTLLDEKAHAVVREAFADMEANADAGKSPVNAKWLPYYLHRFLAGCFGSLLLAEVLATETLMNMFKLDWDGFPAKLIESPAPMSCTNVATMLGTITVIMMVFFALIWTVAQHLRISNWCKQCSSIEIMFTLMLSLVTMPVLSWVLLQIGDMPIPQ